MKIKYIIIVLFLISPLSAAVKPAMTSFNCGEVSPLMLMRSDFSKYDNGCSTLQNMLPLSQGPVTRRPGTYYIADANDPNVVGRLIPFVYSETDAYIMEFGNNTITFYRNGGQIVDDNDVVYELATVFEEDELSKIQYVQLADVMFLVDGTDPPQKLSRYGHSYWTIADVSYIDGPFLDEYLAADSILGDAENYASDEFPSTARELASVSGTASGAVANTNDNDDATYRKRQGRNNQRAFRTWYNAWAYFTIEIPFNSTADKLRQVSYKIGWYNGSSYRSTTRNVSCKIHYETADEWVEISTDTDNYVNVGGDWDDVNGVKLYVYNYTYFAPQNAYAAAYIYEIEAWGLSASDTESINYIKSSNTQTYDRTLDAAAAVDQGGTPNIVRIPSTAHGFLAGDYVTLAGTTNYDGTHQITNVNDVDTFDIASAYTAETFAITDTAISRALIYTMKDTFAPGHIGTLWEIRHPRTDATLSGALAGDVSSDWIDCEGEYKLTTHGTWNATVALERTNDSATTIETVSGSLISSVDDDNISYTGTETESGYKYRVTMSDRTDGNATYNFIVYDHLHTGVVRITDYIDANDVTAEVITELYSVDKTTYHSEGYWSDKNGWPQTIEFHEFRLWYGGSRTYPQTLWTSKTDDYETMLEGTDDDDAIIYMLPSQNKIQWMLSQSYLMIGTLDGAGKLGDPDEAMTPTTQPGYQQQSKNGSAFIQAIMAGDAILYVERGGRKIREFVYAFERDQFVAPDMTVLAEHITTEGIVDIAYQSRPDSTLWCVLADGNTASLTYNEGQDVVAWATHSTEGGDFESVAVIPGEDEDEVWFIVNRTVDSNSVRYIERMKPRDWGSSQSDCFFVDSGLTYEGGDAVYISDVNQTNPAIVTVSSWPKDAEGNNITDGNQIKITGVIGMTELNNNIYTIDDSNVTDCNFTLNNSADTVDVNSIDYTAYISGGTVQRVENSFTGFGHLEGEILKVLADGKVQTDVIVDSNSFTISIWANKVQAGLPYTSILETMPIVFSTQEGSVAASKKRVSEVALNFYKSLGTKYGREGDLDECFTESSLVTGWKNKSWQHGYTKEATIYLEQDKPLPLCVRAIIPTVSVTE